MHGSGSSLRWSARVVVPVTIPKCLKGDRFRVPMKNMNRQRSPDGQAVELLYLRNKVRNTENEVRLDQPSAVCDLFVLLCQVVFPSAFISRRVPSVCVYPSLCFFRFQESEPHE